MPQQSLRKILIVSPHFAPTNAPDMHRTRLMLPYLRALGWEPTVLAIAADHIEGGVNEPLLEQTYPPDIRVVRVRGIPPSATRWAGIGSLWLRCGRALRREGDRLLARERFDLVFFSTTQFEAFQLGPRWKARFGVPYVLDYQDPWVNSYYARTGTKPPGGKFKFAFSQWRARQIEPEALRNAAGIIAVSDAYGPTMALDYKWFDGSRVKVIPFGASEKDLATAAAHQPPEPLVPTGDGFFHHVYAGRCGPDMSTSLSIVFRAFKKFLSANPDEAEKMRFHFVGTDYAPRPLGREWAMPVARKECIEKYVSEHCYRVPYFDALHYLVQADALLVVGSNDPTYSASKIYPFVLAKRPLLIVINALSPIIEIANKIGCGSRYAFNNHSDIERLAENVAKEWFIGGRMREVSESDPVEFLPYTAKGMTQRLATFFDASIGQAIRNP
jgi:hypothetical protein